MAYIIPHPGESFVADNLPTGFKAWFPLKDDGIDMLLTRPERPHDAPVAVQVKWSRDFGGGSSIYKGWYTLKKNKIQNSKADFWIFVVMGLGEMARTFEPHFVIVPIFELKNKIPPRCGDTWHLYLHISGKHCFNPRGMKENGPEYERATKGDYGEEVWRDFTKFLEKWDF